MVGFALYEQQREKTSARREEEGPQATRLARGRKPGKKRTHVLPRPFQLLPKHLVHRRHDLHRHVDEPLTQHETDVLALGGRGRVGWVLDEGRDEGEEGVRGGEFQEEVGEEGGEGGVGLQSREVSVVVSVQLRDG